MMMSKTYILIISSIVLVNADYFGSETISNGIINNPKVEGEDILTWCTISELETEKCEKMAKTILQDKGLFGRDFIEVRCKKAFDTEECMIWVDQGEATLVGLDAGEVYVAGRYHSLVPIAQELYGNGDPYQYSVAVMKKGSLPHVQPGSGLQALRGAKACFPNVGALAGWVMPVHVLMQEGGLKITDCNNHIKSAIEFFGESCAPNSLKDLYNPIGDNSDKLCRLCAGGAGKRCTLADPYAGYEGALKCLLANASGDIAFVKDTTLSHALLSNQIFGGVSEASFELLCRDGSRRPVGDWTSCHWGRAPADALVTSSARTPQQRARYQNLLKMLIKLYGEPNPFNRLLNRSSSEALNQFSSTQQPRNPYDPYDSYSYRNPFPNEKDRQFDTETKSSTQSPFQPRIDPNGRPIELPFQLFRSNTSTDLLVQDATTNLLYLKEEEQAAQFVLNNDHVGVQAEKAVTGIRACPVKRATLCVTSDPEMDKCVKMRIALKAAFLAPTLVCFKGHSTRHCERAVAEGGADFALLDAGDMLHAAHKHRLVPFMQEVYLNGQDWYYAVALAKEEDPDTDLTFLRGKNTCHSGLGHAAGWIFPLAYLLSNGWLRPYGCDGAHAAAQYFAKACVPGALSTEYVDAGTIPPDNLCHLCHGASFRRCRRDASEPYFGAVGALRCLVEGGGTAALVGHFAARMALGGRRRDTWARNLLADDLQLLCPDGTRAPVDAYAACNLGRVPGAVLVGRANHSQLDTFSNLLLYAQQLYGATPADDFSFSMFQSQPPYSDLIFSDAAVKLKPLSHDRRSAEAVAGSALMRAARIVSCDAPQSGYEIASDPEFLSGASSLTASLLSFSLFAVALLA